MDKVIVLFSGGIDSTLALYKCLTEYDLGVHVHHVVIKNCENRYKPESIACEQILNWLRTQGFHFEYSESIMDFNYMLPWDTDVVFFSGGLIAQRDRDIKYFASGSRDIYGPTTEQVEKLFRHIARWDIPDLPVFRHKNGRFLNKIEAWNGLPDPLKELVFYCRTPEYINGKAKECRQCRVCKENIKLEIL